MKRNFIAAAIAATLAANVNAQVTTQGQAFQSGKEFANSAAGKGAASGSISTTSGTLNVPKYNTNPAESTVYGNGRNLISGAGSNKVQNCENFSAGNAYDQQECNAVNYLQNLRTNRVPFTIDAKLDPLMVSSAATIANPGTIPASGTQACHMETTTIPGTFTTENCEESPVLTSFACTKTLLPQCGYVGTPISQYTATKNAAFLSATLTPTGTPGLYDYFLEVPYRTCGIDGTGEIVFNLDTIGFGSYITINMSNLDDAAAIGVNGSTVFAGYPNSGPQYSSGMFSTTSQAFQIGYSWQEDIGGNAQTFAANTKLLDYCPGGYSPISQTAFAYTDPGSGNITTPSSDTPNNIQGFFCNAEGKFLMNRHEGDGTWAGSVSAQMPLQTGPNRISVYWGTGPSSNACGNVRVSGQIYNVAPGCTARWDDQCANARGALQ